MKHVPNYEIGIHGIPAVRVGAEACTCHGQALGGIDLLGKPTSTTETWDTLEQAERRVEELKAQYIGQGYKIEDTLIMGDQGTVEFKDPMGDTTLVIDWAQGQGRDIED